MPIFWHSYECEDKIFEDRGYLCWLVSDDEERASQHNKFEGNMIYRIKARELKEKQTSRYCNRLLVTQILDCNVKSLRIGKDISKQKYNEPLTVEDDILGTLTLDKQYFELSTEIQFGKTMKMFAYQWMLMMKDKDSWGRAYQHSTSVGSKCRKIRYGYATICSQSTYT